VQFDSVCLAKPRQKAGTQNALLFLKQVGNDERTSRAKLHCRTSTEPRFFRLMKTCRPLPPSWNPKQPQAYQKTYLDHGARSRSTPFVRVRSIRTLNTRCSKADAIAPIDSPHRGLFRLCHRQYQASFAATPYERRSCDRSRSHFPVRAREVVRESGRDQLDEGVLAEF
jgi:hypothetical protein